MTVRERRRVVVLADRKRADMVQLVRGVKIVDDELGGGSLSVVR